MQLCHICSAPTKVIVGSLAASSEELKAELARAGDLAINLRDVDNLLALLEVDRWLSACGVGGDPAISRRGTSRLFGFHDDKSTTFVLA